MKEGKPDKLFIKVPVQVKYDRLFGRFVSAVIGLFEQSSAPKVFGKVGMECRLRFLQASPMFNPVLPDTANVGKEFKLIGLLLQSRLSTVNGNAGHDVNLLFEMLRLRVKVNGGNEVSKFPEKFKSRYPPTSIGFKCWYGSQFIISAIDFKKLEQSIQSWQTC